MLGEPFRTIAELYGVSKSQVQRICKEGAWAL
jgi:DNA-directed RNA polymerase specialized sigma subunit